jgi:nucleoside-diphosphate-sugar epimerase
VFHLASAGVQYGGDRPQQIIDVNVHLMTRLLMAVSDWPLRAFISAGSCSEYGPSEKPLSEESPLLPPTIYGASKAAAFLCGRSLAMQLGIPFLHLRLFGAYGAGEASQRLIPQLVTKLSRGRPVTLTGGEQVRDWLYVDDVVRAFGAASMLPSRSERGVYNVCSGLPMSVRQVGETVADQLGAPRELLRWGEIPYRSDEPMRIVGDNHRFIEATDWRPTTTLHEGVSEMIASYASELGSVRAAA